MEDLANLNFQNNLENELKKIYDQQYQNQIPDEQYEDEQEDEELEIDLNDYVLAEEETEFGTYVCLLNIYTCYFKQLFRRQQDETMFDHIEQDQKDSTNRCMEFLYEEINKFNNSKEEDKDVLYSPDDTSIEIEKCNEMFILYINDIPTYVCKYLLPIMKHLATLDWSNIRWSIIPIKTT